MGRFEGIKVIEYKGGLARILLFNFVSLTYEKG